MPDKIKAYYKGFSLKFKTFLVLTVVLTMTLGIALFANATGGPTITITPSNGSIISLVKPTITANLSSPIDNSKTVFKLNTTTLLPTYDSSTNTLTYQPTYDMPDGTYTVDLTVYDTSGNSSNATSTFIIKTSRPTVTKYAPDKGTSSANPLISIDINDPDNIKQGSATMKLDGNAFVPTMSFQEQGYWDTDYETGSWIWVVTGYDYTNANISYQAKNLALGTHQVELSVSDAKNNILNYRWSFDVAVPPSITEAYPAEGGKINNKQPTVSAKIVTTPETGSVDPSSIKVLIDNVQVPSYYDSSTGLVTATSTGLLNDGSHSWQLTATSVKGITAVNKFNFSVDTVLPVITMFPVNGTVINDETIPKIGFNFSDSSSIDESSVEIKFDGVVVPATVQYHEIWEYPAYSDPVYVGLDYNNGTVYNQPTVLDGGTHTVTVKVADKAGNLQTGTTSFKSTLLFSITNMQPAPNSFISNATPAISFAVSKPANVNFGSLVMKVDNVQVNPVVDQVLGTITYVPAAPLPEGDHQVYASLLDTAGKAVTKSWSFTSDGNGPTLTLSPADGARVTTIEPGKDSDRINVTFKDMNSINESSIVFQLSKNGGPMVDEPYQITYNEVWDFDPYSGQPYFVGIDSKNGKISSVNTYGDGTYTARLIVKDSKGNVTDKTWNFVIAVAPQATSITPANGATSPNNAVHIKVELKDANGPAIDPASIRLFIGDNQVNATYTSTGTNTGVVEADAKFANESTVIATLSAADTLGNKSDINWKFAVNIYGEMPITPESCSACHNIDQYGKHVHSKPPSTEVGAGLAKHGQTGNCGHCHNSSNIYQQTEPHYCAYCHGADDPNSASPIPPSGSYPALAGKSCFDCHSKKDTWTGAYLTPVVTGYPNEPTPTYPVKHNIFETHQTTNKDCVACHATNLTREHNIRKDANGNSLTCNTCHKSTRTEVINAINNGNTDCTACHGNNHEKVHPDGLDNNCLTCHVPALSTEHLKNTKTQKKLTDSDTANDPSCATCHQSNRADVMSAIASGDLTCAACHDKAHTLPIRKVNPKDIPLYPGLEWSQPMAASTWAGESWMNDEFLATGQVMVSKRSNNITGDNVWSYYNQQLVANGWALQGSAPAAGSNFFTATFTKSDSFTLIDRKLIINFYGGENHTAGPVVSTGYRVELIYR